MYYKIEKAKQEDIDDIYKIICDRCLWFENKGIYGWNLKSYTSNYDKEYFKEQMKTNELYIAKLNDKICGVMLLKNEDKIYWNDNASSYYLKHLATDINIKGVGECLINYAKELAKTNKKEYLRLDCYQESEFLNNYYQKLGFINVGKGVIADEPEDYKYNLYEMKI